MPILQALVPNAMCLALSDLTDIPPFDTLAAGCGLRMTDEKKALLYRLMARARRCVLDAGALPLAAEGLPHPQDTLLTPHPGEAARLLEWDTAAVMKDPLGAAALLQQKSGAAVVLKGAVSVIRSADRTALNTVGTPALAKGGSGDALAGILAAEMCVQPDVFEAARIGCLRLGMAGLRGEEKYGTDSLLTGEMLACLP